MKILELLGSVNTGLYTKEEHIRFLNDVTIIRRKNPRWKRFVLEYMEKNNLKPEDLKEMIGPKPWEEDMDAETITLQPTELEQTESRSDKELMGDAIVSHFEEKDKKLGKVKDHFKETLEASSSTECPKCDVGMVITGEHTGSWVCPECGWNIGYPEGESVSLKFLQDNVLHQEERDPIPALDRRMKVIVSEESGWLCLDCNRVWPNDFDDCATCKLGKKAAEPPTVEHRGWGDEKTIIGEEEKEFNGCRREIGHGMTCCRNHLCFACERMSPEEDTGLEMNIKCTECEPGDDLYAEVKSQEDMDFAEKAKLMLQLKAKEKEDATDTTQGRIRRLVRRWKESNEYCVCNSTSLVRACKTFIQDFKDRTDGVLT